MSVREAIRRVVIPPIGAGFIRTLARSMRLRVHGEEHVDVFHRRGQRVIIAFWHSQQLMMPLAYRGQEAHILISQHRDGELISQIVARFGLRSVRGSSTRGGIQALRELIRLGRSGVDLVVTPDGPKGPRHIAKLGAVQLAKATGMPIIPLAFGCSKKNSSPAGISSWFPIRSLAAHSAGALPCGSRGNPMIRRWKRCASNSKQR